MTSFYSNCLFEAIKAKLKNPKNVHIHLIPKTLKKRIHFYWYNLEDNENYGVYSFITLNNSKQHIWFKGLINNESVEMWESFLYNEMSKKGFSEEQKIEYARKHGFVHKKPFKYSRLSN